MIINGPNLDIHQKGNGWTDTSEPCAVSGNEINLYVLYMKTGYSSRIYFHQRPSRQPYCCQTKLFSQSPTFWKNYLTSHHYFLVSFYHTQSIYYLPHTGFIPPALIHPSVHFPRKKSKSLDLANKRLHNPGLCLPSNIPSPHTTPGHTEFLLERPPASGPLSILPPSSGTSTPSCQPATSHIILSFLGSQCKEPRPP